MEDNQNIEEQNILPKMDRDLLTEMEQSMEDDFKRAYQQEDVASILDSIEYIRIYCRNFPLFNGDDYQPLQAPFAYYRSRNTYLKELPFTEDEFYNFTLIQVALNKLELQPQPTFEFIAFLYHIIKVWFHTILWSERIKEYESALSNILWSRHCWIIFPSK